MIKRLLIIGLLLTLVAGFSFGAAESEGTTSDGRLTITVRPWTARGTTLQPDSAVELYLEQRYNVQLEPWYGIDSYDSEGRDVRLAAGDVPDYLGGFSPGWVDIGIVRELPRDMIRKHMPGYMVWADKYLGDEVWRRTTIDGVNYAVPTALSMASTGQAMGFRGDWMRAVGVDPTPIPGQDFFAGPDSLAEIESLLTKFRNEDPDGNGRKDSYGWAVWKNNTNVVTGFLPNVFGSFGVRLAARQSVGTWDVRNGEPYYSTVDPNYRDALEYINGWWEEELIHPDVVNMLRADFVRAIANGEIGAWSSLDAWMSNYGAGPWGAYREVNPDGDIAYSITPVGPNGQRGTWYRDPNWGPWAIGINASDEVAIKIMQMMEDIYTTRDEYAFNFFGGAEGETWQVDDRGYAVSIPGTGSAKDSAEGTRLGVRMFVGHVAHIVPPVDKVYIAPNRHALQGYFEQTQAPGPPIGFRPTWDEAERALLANINTIEQEFFWRAVTGQIDVVSAWDDYVERMMNAGLDRLLDSVAAQR